jgi:hypothetical protein
VNRTRSPLPPLCTGTRGGGGDRRRSTTRLPGCVVDRHHVPRKHSWADAATPTQLGTRPARARAAGTSVTANTSDLISEDNPGAPQGAARGLAGLPGLAAALTCMDPGGLAGLLARIGDRMFAMNDAEARWRDWEMQRRNAGLGRRYRDARFGRHVQELPLALIDG